MKLQHEILCDEMCKAYYEWSALALGKKDDAQAWDNFWTKRREHGRCFTQYLDEKYG